MENEPLEESEERKEPKYLLTLEKRAREYLETTNSLVRDMNENYVKEKVEKTVDKIFENQKLEKEKQQEKEENQKERGSN